MTTSLKWIKPSNIREIWPTIKPGIDIIEGKTDTWIAEQLYHLILTGSVSLHIYYEDKKYTGFIITQQYEFCGEKTLHIFAAYSKGNDFDILKENTETIKEWGRNIEATKITFSTRRKGWLKVGPKLGYQPSSLVTYELKL